MVAVAVAVVVPEPVTVVVGYQICWTRQVGKMPVREGNSFYFTETSTQATVE